jgi:hypothetical protein
VIRTPENTMIVRIRNTDFFIPAPSQKCSQELLPTVSESLTDEQNSFGVGIGWFLMSSIIVPAKAKVKDNLLDKSKKIKRDRKTKSTVISNVSLTG